MWFSHSASYLFTSHRYHRHLLCFSNTTLSDKISAAKCRISGMLPKILSAEIFFPPIFLSAEIYCPLKFSIYPVPSNYIKIISKYKHKTEKGVDSGSTPVLNLLHIIPTDRKRMNKSHLHEGGFGWSVGGSGLGEEP